MHSSPKVNSLLEQMEG